MSLPGPKPYFLRPHMDKQALYRQGVGIVLRYGHRVFIAKRTDVKEGPACFPWQMPQGGIDTDETPYTAAVRELYEETGIRSTRLVAEIDKWIYYDLPPAISHKLWSGRYKGQKQKWFLFDFTGQEDEINLTIHTPEFCAWAWVPWAQALEKVVPFKRPVYEQVFKHFAPYFTEPALP